MHNETPIQVTVDFSPETTEARRCLHSCRCGKKSNCQPRILYLATLSFRNEGGRNTFSEEGQLKEFAGGPPTLKEWLIDALQQKVNNNVSSPEPPLIKRDNRMGKNKSKHKRLSASHEFF